MRVVSPLLKHVVYPGLSRTGYLRQRTAGSVSVVTYHGVFPEGYQIIDPQLDGNLLASDRLRKQIIFFKVNYEVISPDDFRASCEGKYEIPQRAILLTCDDGLRNQLTAMLPVLVDAGVKCLFFVTDIAEGKADRMLWHERLYLQLLAAAKEVRLELPDIGMYVRASGVLAKRDLWRVLVDRLSPLDTSHRWQMLERLQFQLGLPESWDRKYRGEPDLAERFQTMTAQEVKQLVAAGMTIGSHTHSHPKLSLLSRESAINEMHGNRRQLEQILGTEVWALAYPFGDPSSISDRVFSWAEECGFTCAFVNYERPAQSVSRFALPRVHVTTDMGLSELEARLSGFHTSIRRLLA